jgi:hypothetical protein
MSEQIARDKEEIAPEDVPVEDKETWETSDDEGSENNLLPESQSQEHSPNGSDDDSEPSDYSPKKNPKGRKRKNEPRPAKYHNWHTPFCWSQIKIAAKQVGWKMSASAIVRALNRTDPETFAGISRTTVEAWIDRKGPKPRWSDAVLKKVEQGND